MVLEAASEHPEIVASVTDHLAAAGGSASGLLPRISRNMKEKGAIPVALAIASIYGAIQCFGFGGTLLMLFKNMLQGVTKPNAGTD